MHRSTRIKSRGTALLKRLAKNLCKCWFQHQDRELRLFGLDVHLERAWRYNDPDEEIYALRKAFDIAIANGYKREHLLKSVRPCYCQSVAHPNANEIETVVEARVLQQE